MRSSDTIRITPWNVAPNPASASPTETAANNRGSQTETVVKGEDWSPKGENKLCTTVTVRYADLSRVMWGGVTESV